MPAFVIVRFKEVLDKCQRTEKGCAIWPGKSPGYGTLTIGGKTYLAHRIAYVIDHGEIPAGKLVCHTCDVPARVEGSHLFVGSDLDNAMDRERKGRGRKGGPALVEVHTRFFAEDIAMIQQRADVSGLPWQIELRLLIRRALKNEVKEFHLLK